MKKNLVLLLLLSILAICNGQNNCYPETVYMSLGEYYSPEYTRDEDFLGRCSRTLQISFSTVDQCPDSYIIVQKGLREVADFDDEDTEFEVEDDEDEDPFSEENSSIIGRKQQIVHQSWNGEKFCHNGKKCEKVYYSKYIHYFSFDLCSFQKRFTYKIYGDINTSQPRVFKGILPYKQKRLFKVQSFLAFGDHEISENGNYTISKLDKLVKQRKEYEAFLFLGDYAYEFYQNNATKGDIYMNKMEPYYSRWPLMFSPGNHEDCFDFAFINQKFHMMNNITKQDNNVFSFNIGKVHFLSINLHHFNNGTGVVDPAIQESMLKTVERDLIQANFNRRKQPWIFILGHKPVYCVGRFECLDYYVQYQQFDSLFYKYGVDIFLAAHQHESTQFYPMYKNQTMPYHKMNKNVIINPKSYMQIIQGNGGSNDMYHTDEFYNATWVLSRSFDPGYGQFQIINDNLLQIQNYDTKTNTTLKPTRIYTDHSYHRFPHSNDFLETE